MNSGLRFWSGRCVCVCVCVANLRAPVLDVLYATDASDDLLAAVASPLPSEVAKEAYRHCLVKGAWSRLLPQAHALLRTRADLAEDLEFPTRCGANSRGLCSTLPVGSPRRSARNT